MDIMGHGTLLPPPPTWRRASTYRGVETRPHQQLAHPQILWEAGKALCRRTVQGAQSRVANKGAMVFDSDKVAQQLREETTILFKP